VNLPGESSVDAFKIPFETLPFDKPHFIKVRLLDGAREIDSGFYWRSCNIYKGPKTTTGPCTAGFEQLANLPTAKIALDKISSSGRKDVLKVSNIGDKIAFLVHITPKGVPAAGTHYSDNWFSLLPGESKVVEAEHPAGGCSWAAADFPNAIGASSAH